MTTEYTDFEAATAAVHAEVSLGSKTVTMKCFQRPADLAWVWAVTSVDTPVAHI